MNTRRHILITGSNRSGSTWVGKVLAMNSRVDNIIEPLNLNRIQRFKKFDITSWYLKINDQANDYIKGQAHDLFSYYLHTTYGSILRRPFESFEGHNFLNSIKKRLRKARKPIKMLKDPIALFSVPWLVAEFEVRPVILVRHPAAYVLSIKEKDWWFDFDSLLSQPHFFDGELEVLREEVTEFKKFEKQKSIVENAALLWKVFYTQVAEYRRNQPGWFYITHEELSIDPLLHFKKMFEYLDIEFVKEVQHYILESTQALDQAEFNRDSAKNTTKWVEKLTDDEKRTIYQITKEVSDQFYPGWH